MDLESEILKWKKVCVAFILQLQVRTSLKTIYYKIKIL